MYEKHPEMAKRWERHTPKGKTLPEKVGGQMNDTFFTAFMDELQKIASGMSEESQKEMKSQINKWFRQRMEKGGVPSRYSSASGESGTTGAKPKVIPPAPKPKAHILSATVAPGK